MANLDTVGTPVRRCAIYTRKSSEEGLEQDFNSLHAQREACEAFIKSQRGEGWRLLPESYDDGGISGGTMERPALQRLLSDIESGRINVIVVYKVDRLTRALSDFARMVEVFDRHGVSFVSITQQFNTTTSMGRLTLNVLLSFAQFEREVTGERIRDKIAASKRKGMWMGGVVPLGYRVEDRKLVVVPAEVDQVRLIYRRYLALSGVPELVRWLRSMNHWTRGRSGSPGNHFGRGGLYCLLSNRVYVGEVEHKGVVHPGQQEAIVDRDLWESAQAKLKAHTTCTGSVRKTEVSALIGKLFDADGHRLKPSHANKNGRQYRYYVSQRPDDREEDPNWQPWRLPARDLENRVLDTAGAMLLDGNLIAEAAELAGIDSSKVEGLIWTGKDTKPSLQLIDKITLGPDSITVALGLPGANALKLEQTVPMSIRRKGHERRLVISALPSSNSRPVRQDARLIRALGHGLDFWQRMLDDPHLMAVDIGKKEGLDNRYVGRSLQLAFLAPDLIEAVAKGDLPEGWSAERVLRMDGLPLSWEAQREMFARG